MMSSHRLRSLHGGESRATTQSSRLIRRCASPSAIAPSISVGAGAACTSTEAVAADDVEDDVEYSDNDLHKTGVSALAWIDILALRTVAITLTMIMMMLAMAETTASIAPAIAETMVPCGKTMWSTGAACSTRGTHTIVTSGSKGRESRKSGCV